MWFGERSNPTPSISIRLPSKQYMFNLIVDDLDGALQQVQAGGAELVGKAEAYDNGRFAWFMDPEGNKVELWEPKLS